jgi:hypothetical protein
VEVAEEEAQYGERAEEDEEHVGGEGHGAGAPHRAVVVHQPPAHRAHRPAPGSSGRPSNTPRRRAPVVAGGHGLHRSSRRVARGRRRRRPATFPSASGCWWRVVLFFGLRPDHRLGRVSAVLGYKKPN